MGVGWFHGGAVTRERVAWFKTTVLVCLNERILDSLTLRHARVSAACASGQFREV